MNKQHILDQAAKMAEQAMGQPQPQRIQPQPVPMSVSLGQIRMPDGKMGVAMVVATPVGESTYFFDADQAKKIADGLHKAATASSGGLVVPG